MTKAAETAPKAPAKKPSFNAAALGALKAVAGIETTDIGRALLDDIEPDPHQPRKEHTAADLEALAYSIKEKGVLQPIGVRPGVNTKWMLVWGEGRWRASKLAGVADIPFIVAKEGQTDFESQVIENQQRSRLSNSDLARAVQLASESGRKNGEIAKLYRLKDYEISAYRAVEKFPAFLRAILDTSDMRGLYDLYRLAKTKAEAVEKAVKALYPAGVSYADAQRIISNLGGNGNNNFTAKSDDKPEKNAKEAPSAGSTSKGGAAPSSGPSGRSSAAEEAERMEKARMIVADLGGDLPQLFVAGADGEVGRLLFTRRAKGAGMVIVQFESFTEEVPAEGLRVVGVK